MVIKKTILPIFYFDVSAGFSQAETLNYKRVCCETPTHVEGLIFLKPNLSALNDGMENKLF